MPMQRKQRGQPENNNEALGLMANGSSGGWEVSVDEATKGPERWFVQLEGQSVYFAFEIPSPEMIATALEFLEGHSSPKGTHSQFSAENGSLILGKHRQIPVILVHDDEYKDRFFLIIGQEADVVVRFTIAGEDLTEIKEALRQATEDLEEQGERKAT
jgi:hypothetical protein